MDKNKNMNQKGIKQRFLSIIKSNQFRIASLIVVGILAVAAIAGVYQYYHQDRANAQQNEPAPTSSASDCLIQNSAQVTGSNINVMISNTTQNQVDCDQNYAIGIQKTPSAYLFEIDQAAPQTTSYTYFLDYGNKQTTTLTGVVITDVLDSRIEYIPSTCAGGISCSYDAATRTLSWNIGTLAPNQFSRAQFQVNFKEGYSFAIAETIPNTAVIDSNETGPDQDAAYVSVRYLNPDINITKDTDQIYHNLNDQVIYTIGYENTKNQPLTGVYITDVLDTRLSFVSCTGNCSYNATTRTVRWEIGNLAVGETGTRFLTVQVQGTGVINNEAVIYSNETQPDYDDVNIIITTDEYVIKIVKTASESTVRRGETYTYTLDYSNPSDDTPLTGVIITDQLTDNKIDFVAGSCVGAVPCTYDAATRTLSWNVGNMAIGATGQVKFNVKVKENAALESIFNMAVIDSNETAPDDSAAIVDIIDYAIDIQKTPSSYLFEIDPANPQNTSYTYYLDYSNKEATPLTGVVITDTLDNRIEYIPGSCSGAVSCTYDSPSRTLSWNVGNMAANATGRVQFNVNFKQGYTFTRNESIPNTAFIDSNETPIDQDSAYVNVRFTNPDINIDKTVPKVYYDNGDTVDYTIGFQNTSSQPLTGVYITDRLDPRLAFVSCTGGCTYNASTRTVRWEIGNLAVGASATRYLTVQVQGLGVINNEAIIFSNETQPDYDDVNIIVTPLEYEIKIIKTASESTVRRGDTYTYTLDYSNPSDDTPLTGVVITDVLTDTKIDYVAGSCSNSCIYNATTRTLTWNIGNMAIGATGKVTFQVKVKDNAALEPIFNTATIDSNETDPDDDTVIVDIIDYAIDIQKTPSSYLFEIDPANPQNTSYTYYLDYSNKQATPLTGVVITDTLDNRIEYVANSCSGAVTCSYDSATRTLTWNVGNMAANATARVQFNVNFKQGYSFTVNESIPNTAFIDSNETPVDQDSAYVNVRFTNPDINIDKTAPKVYYDNGEQVQYTIAFQNTKNQPLTGVYITDRLDPRLAFVSCTGGCTYNASTRTVRWEIGDLAVGASASRYLTVEVQGLGVINNEAIIFSNETQPDYDDVNIIVTPLEYEIKIIKRASETTVRRGETYTYTLDYSNPSDDTPLTGVVITDVLTDNKIDFVPGSCSGDVTCTYNAATRTLTWSVGNMAIGATGQVQFDVKVTDNAPIQPIFNTATIDSNETDPDDDTVIVDIVDYDIFIQKTPSSYLFEIDPANPQNTSYTYYLDYGNSNSTTALTGVVITDTLDNRIEYVNNSCTGSCTYDSVSRTITWNIGNLAASATGRVEFKVTFKQGYSFTQNESIPNTAIIDSNETPPDQDSAYVNVRFINPDINITKDVDKTYHDVGDQVLYTINYQNTSNQPLTGVYITDVLDPRLDFVSCTSLCTYNAQTRTVRWTIGNLAVGQSATVYLNVSVNGTGVINNKATIYSNETQPDYDDVNIIITPQEYEIKIIKEANRTRVRPGETYTYTLDYSNPSDDTPLTGVVITDVLTDPKIDFVPGSCTGSITCTYDAATRTLTWNVGSMAIAATGQVKFDVKVKDNAPLENILNTAVIDSNETDPDDDAAVVEIIDYGVDLTKTASVTTLKINPFNPSASTYTYTLSYSNIEAQPLTEVVLTDTLDSRINYVSGTCSNTCTYDSGTRTLTWNIGNLAVGATGSVNFQVSLANDHTFTQNEVIPNVAIIDSRETDPVQDDVDVIIQLQTFDITIVKTASKSQVIAGETYTYTINYTNPSSESTLTGVVLTDPITDTRINYVAGSCSNSCTYNSSTKTLTWNIGTLAPGATGQRTFQVKVIDNPTLGTIVNTATIDSNETPAKQSTANVEIAQYSITIDKTASSTTFSINPTAPQNTIYTYTLTYGNPSAQPLTNVILTDTLDNRIAYRTGTCSNACMYDATSRTLTWNLGTLPAQTTGQVTFDVNFAQNHTFTNGESIPNTAIIDSTETPPAQDTETVTVTVLQPAIGITKDSDKTTYQLNEQVTYTINYVNNGQIPLTGVYITDPLDAKLEYVSCNGNGSVCSYNSTTKTVRFDIGNLAINGTGSVIIVAKAIGTGTIPNVATIHSNETPNATDDANIIVLAPSYQISIVKTASKSQVIADETYTYTLTYRNNTTNANLTNVVITDPVTDPKITYVANSCSNSCTYNSTTKTLTWNIGTLTPGQQGTVTFQAKVNSGEQSGTINNTATITSTEVGPVSSTAQVQIIAYNIAITKTASTNIVSVNNANPAATTYSYTLSYSNPSQQPLTGVVITDQLTDTKINYVANTCSTSCTYDSATRTLSWTIGNLAAGATGTVTFQVNLATGRTYVNGETITNTAVIDSNETPPVQDDEVVLINVPVYQIALQKAVDDTTVVLNQVVTYTLTYSNPSSTTALTGVVITDPINANLEYVANSCSNSCTFNSSTKTLTWNIGNLAASATATVTFQAKLINDQVNSVPNTATINSNEAGPVNATVVITPIRYALSIEKTASAYKFVIDPAKPEQTTWTYFVDYANQSNAQVTNAVVTDTVPTELDYVANSCSNSCTYDTATRKLTWNLGTLAAQATGRVEFKVSLKSGTTYTFGQYIKNTATITSSEVGPRSDDVDVQIVYYALIFTKTVDATLVQPNQVVRYTINYEVPQNNGPLTSVVVTDQLRDARVNYVEGSCGTCAYNSGTRTMTWNLGTLPAGTKGSVTYQVQVVTKPAAGTIDNLARITSNELPPKESVVTIRIPNTIETVPTGGWAVISTLLTAGLMTAIAYITVRTRRSLKVNK